MNITTEKIDDLNVIIRMSVEKSDYDDAVITTLKQYRKTAQIPGFRQGKVPVGVIKKMYGKSVVADEVNKLISTKLMSYIQEEKLDILGEPLPNDTETKDINWDTDETFEFAFDLGLSPEVTVAVDKRKKLPYYTITVDANMVQNQIDGFANRFGQNTPAESVEIKDSVKGTMVQVDENGTPVEGGVNVADVLVAIDLIQDEAVKASFEGKVVGDAVAINPVTAMNNNHEVAHMLKVKVEEIDTVDTTFSYTVTDILRFKAHEINEDLYKQVLGEDTDITTQEQFEAKVKEDITTNLVYSSDYRFGIDAAASLKSKANFDLPVAFLKRWIVETNEEMTAETVEKEWSNFEEDLKWTLIKNSIAAKNEIQVTPEQVEALAKEYAKSQFQQYGLFNVTEEQLGSFSESILANEQEKRKLVEKQLENNVFAVVKEKVTLDQIEISQKDFDNLFEAEK